MSRISRSIGERQPRIRCAVVAGAAAVALTGGLTGCGGSVSTSPELQTQLAVAIEPTAESIARLGIQHDSHSQHRTSKDVSEYSFHIQRTEGVRRYSARVLITQPSDEPTIDPKNVSMVLVTSEQALDPKRRNTFTDVEAIKLSAPGHWSNRTDSWSADHCLLYSAGSNNQTCSTGTTLYVDKPIAQETERVLGVAKALTAQINEEYFPVSAAVIADTRP